MSTANKLTYLNQTKQKLKQAINNIGGSIDDNTTFRQYANQLQNVYDNLSKTEYQEGTEITLSNTLKGKLDFDNGVVGIGQSSQDGTPTPSTPIAINSVTGNQDVVVSGKNIYIPTLKVEQTDINQARCDVSLDGDEYSLTATGQDMYFGEVTSIGTTYTQRKGEKISVKGKSKLSFYLTNTLLYSNYITAYDENGVSLGYTAISSYKGVYNIPSGADFVTMRFGLANATTGTTYKTKVMLTFSDTEDTTYEPYITPKTYQLSLGDIELNAIGNYKDELIYDVDEDKVYKNEVIGKKILNGGNDENWAYETAYNRFGLTETINDYNITLRTTAICNYYRYGDTSIDNYFALSSNGKLALFHAPTNISTLAEWKTWLSTNNLILYYILETAIKEEITGTLKDQIKALYNSQSFTGTTIITPNGNLPMIIKCRGLKGE